MLRRRGGRLTDQASEPGQNLAAREARATLPWHLAAAGLFAAAAATVLWQNRRVAVLFDLGYVLDTAWRIAAGDIPYRDFPLPHAPGTFLLQALVVKLFDASFMTHAVYAALIGGASAVLTLGILELQLAPAFPAFRLLALAMAVPLVVLNVYAIYPHPFYDSDACFLMLLALWALLECRRRHYPPGGCLAAGALLLLPVFVKQNLGAAFFALSYLSLLSLWCEGSRARAGLGWTVAGSVAAALLALLVIHVTMGLEHYWTWTVVYPASRPRFEARHLVEDYLDAGIWLCVGLSLVAFALVRQPTPRRGALTAAVALTSVLPLWVVAQEVRRGVGAGPPVAIVIAFWPYLCALSLLVLVLMVARTPLRFPSLLPVILVGTVEAAFLSQGAAGSTYGLFPVLVLLQGSLVTAFRPPDDPRRTWPAWAFALVGAASLTIAGSGYIVRNDRLSYADVRGGDVHASAAPRLHGMASSGPWVGDLDQLLAWVEANVPPSEPVMTIPGEDPFFYALRRRPRMPALLLERTTVNPYTDLELADFVRDRGIVWLVHKTKLQCCAPIAKVKDLLPLLTPYFDLVQEIGPYRVYRRNART